MPITPPKNETQVHRFESGSFLENVVKPRLDNPSLFQASTQLNYLAKFLNDLHAKTIVVETHYIDRHYMDEFQHYYANCLIDYSHSCSRIHAFKTVFTADQFDEAISVVDGEYNKRLQAKGEYLGFVVLRPIPEAMVGRTFLATLPKTDGTTGTGVREFPVTYSREVHLAGLTLQVQGLPFQQQDRRVGACATTAIWVALAKMAKTDGGRHPTPASITNAAVKSIIHTRAYPNLGLTDDQICESFRTHGYSPDEMNVAFVEHTQFKATIGIYLSSGIPVLFGIRNVHGEGHAITACGFKFDPSMVSGVKLEKQNPTNKSIQVIEYRTSLVHWNQIYFHDDRIGPYARGDVKSSGLSPNQIQSLLTVVYPGYSAPEDWGLIYAITPLYPKLRACANDLLKYGTEWLDIVRLILKCSYSELSLNIKFQQSGKVLNNLHTMNSIQAGKAEFLRQIALSRYVGMVEISFSGSPVITLYVDATDRIVSNSELQPPLTPFHIPHQTAILGVVVGTSSPLQSIVPNLKSFGLLVAHT